MHNLGRECFWARSILFLLALFGACQSGWAQGQAITFSVTADIPYGTKEIPKLQAQITNHNKYSPSLLFMHLGDILSGNESCNESRYALVAAELKRLAVPAFMVPGDNETNDCKNPAQGFGYWQQYFSDFEQYFCGAPVVEHQNVRHENIAFIMNGVLFIGLNLVAGTIGDENAWNARLQDNANWVDQQFKAKVSQVRAAVIFVHAGPATDRALFFDQFVQSAAAFKKPVLYLHGSDHAWKQDNPWPTSNTIRVVVDNGAAADPVEVTVTTNMSKPSTAFTFNRKPWSSQTIVNMPPCANAGPDQAIAAMSTTLSGNATDDGDPNNSLTTNWSKVSGPGTVTFENADALATTASFSANGIYVLRLTANDGQLQKADEVTIGVNTSIGDLPIVSSFTPTSGATETTVTITGSKFTGATSVAFNGTPASFTVNSDTKISTAVPAGATTGKIAVTNSIGTGTSADDFVVNTSTGSLPVVSSFTPASGAAGAAVTITGSKFTGATSVAFNGTPASFTVNSDAQISTTAPAGVTTGKIVVTNSFGTGISANDFVVNTSGGAGTSLTFNPTADAFVWSLAATANYGSAKELRVEANSASDISNIYFKFNVSGMGGLVQSAKLRLAVTDGTDNGGSIFWVANDYPGTSTPWVETGLSWNNAPAITGSALSSLGAVSSGQKVDLDVTAVITGNGVYSFAIKTGSSNSGLFYSKEGNIKPELIIQVGSPPVQPPAITAFTPANGPVATEVTITGSHFNGTTMVAFNNAPASFTVDSDTQIRATVPAGATNGKISVANAAGTGLSETDFTITSAPLTFSFAPTHDAFVKLSEPTSLNGTVNTLRAKASANEVFNTYLKFETTGLNGTLLNAKLRLHVSDAGPDGGAVYLVSNNYKSSTTPWSESGLHWNNAPPIAPLGEAALNSTGAVSLGQWVEFEVTSAIVGNGTYSFGLKNNNADQVYYRSKEFGAATSPQLVIQSVASGAPSITSFAPADGPVGTMVTIAGNNFTGTKSVTFSGKAAQFILDSNTQLRATVPAGAIPGKIKITNASGSASYAQNFIVTVQPVIASFTPTNGIAGTQVTITGSYFNGTSSVTINGKAATAFFLDSASKLRANVPAGATVGAGKIVVTNSAGSTTSTADFTVNRLLSFAPQHDAYVNSSEPAINFGTAGTLQGKLGATEVMHSYLKFNVAGLNGTILSAKLRLQVADASPSGGSVHLVSNDYLNTTTPWVETGLTWDNAPGIASATLSSKGAVSIGQWMEFDVSAAILGNGTYSFGLKSDNSDAVYYRAKENGATTLPKLVIQIAASPSGMAKRADSTASEGEKVTAFIPTEFVLQQNYPNPFNPSTQIQFGLPQALHVTIKVYTITGAEAETLVDGHYPAGMHAVMFHAENLSSGTYFYVMQAGEVRQVRRLMLVR